MKLNDKKGISLIVLVITIAVMIILAAAIILSLQSSGIIGRANEAKTKTDVANAKQVLAMAKAEWELINPQKRGIFKDYAEAKLIEAGFKVGEGINSYIITDEGKLISGGENTIYKDISGIYVVVPKGFVVSKATSEDTIEEGLVIYKTDIEVVDDNVETAKTTYDQFVWIPVADINEFKRVDGYREGAPETVVLDGTVTEPYAYDLSITEENDLTGEYAEYAAMKASVEKYGGFFIARYETGTTNERKSDIDNGTSVDSNGNPVVLSRADQYVYNHVTWGVEWYNAKGNAIDANGYNQGKGAVELSRGLYPKDENYSVVSTLCYGVQWDAIVNYLKNIKNPNGTKNEYFVHDSHLMGYYIYNSVTLPQKTGYYSVNNIYDLAGNVTEMTMEVYGKSNRVMRGGSVSNAGYNRPMSIRSAEGAIRASYSKGFRIALYIK